MLQISPPTSPRVARRRRTVAFAIVACVAGLLAAVLSLYQVSVFPPSVQKRYLDRGAAVGRAAVQLHPARPLNTPPAFEGQAKRGNLIANAMSSEPIRELTARQLGVSTDQIAAKALLNEGTPQAFSEPDNERRATSIVESEAPYELELQARPTVPIIEIYAEGPTQAGAEALVTASIAATNRYLGRVAAREGQGPPQPVTLTPLGQPRGGPLESVAPKEIALLAFLVVSLLTFGLLWTIAAARRGWLAAAPERRDRGALEELGGRLGPIRAQLGDWPRTTRVMPWMVAGFIALIWLVPVNTIWLDMSLPIDLKLDRIALPLVVGAWLLALIVGGRNAPRVRLTKVHVAIGIFVAVAFLSVVLNSTELARTLEFGLAVKKLSLLAAVGIFFLIVASVVRPSEVRPFMTFILILATIMAVGMLIEYRSAGNLFYEWSARILPSVFHTTSIAARYDEVGRREVLGTADVSLEAVAMLALALPIALSRLLERSTTPRSRVVYWIVTLVLLGAMVATYRKSALLAPVVVVLVMVCFRPRQMARLAPLGLIVLVALPIIAPNALGSVIEQFQPHKLGVATVSDRVSDYDAIRPDVLSHLAFGRGFGSYEHSTYRTLDNDILMRLVESGIVGLLAWLAMLIGIIAIAAPLIRGGDPRRGPPALAIAAAAAGFLVMSVLFDLMSFPQTPYILVALAGLLAVLTNRPEPIDAAEPTHQDDDAKNRTALIPV
jgi:hypothetical protein